MKSKKSISKSAKINKDLDANTIVIVKAYFKETGEELVKEMTLAKWQGLKKSSNYDYKCLQKS